MKKILALAGLLFALAATPAFADTYVTVPHPQAVFDSTLGTVYSLCPPGSSTCTVLSTQTGTNNFTGSFSINGVAETFPTSGLIVGTTDAQTLTNKTLTAPAINSATGIGQTAMASSTTATALTSTTTLAAITGLSVPVAASGTYYCSANLPITANASGGVQVAFAGANSMTATSANYTALTSTTTVNNAATNTTTFGNAVGGYTGAATNVALQGTVVVNAGGNLIVEGAQNASNGSATTFLANSTLNCIRTN